MKYTNIEKCRKYSEDMVSVLKSDFEKELDNKNIFLVTTGSFARGEASEHSDLDLFVIAKNKVDVRSELACDKSRAKEDSFVFRELKDMSKNFSYILERTLKAVYPAEHPVHHALLF